MLGKFSDLKLEILVEFELKDATSFGFKLFQSSKTEIGELIEFKALNNKIKVGNVVGKLKTLEILKPIKFHIFIDKSVVEIIINDQVCITSRIYPKTIASDGFDLYAEDGIVNIKSLNLWTLKSIW